MVKHTQHHRIISLEYRFPWRIKRILLAGLFNIILKSANAFNELIFSLLMTVTTQPPPRNYTDSFAFQLFCYFKCYIVCPIWLLFLFVTVVDVATFAAFFEKQITIEQLMIYEIVAAESSVIGNPTLHLYSLILVCGLRKQSNFHFGFLMTFFLQAFTKTATLFGIFIFSLFGTTCHVKIEKQVKD